MTTELSWAIAQSLILRAPSLVVGVLGLWFAVARRGVHPRVSFLGIIGFGCLLVSVIVFLAIQVRIQVATASGSGAQVSEVLAIWNLIAYPLNLISLAAIGVAVFIDRVPAAGSSRSSGRARAA